MEKSCLAPSIPTWPERLWTPAMWLQLFRLVAWTTTCLPWTWTGIIWCEPSIFKQPSSHGRLAFSVPQSPSAADSKSIWMKIRAISYQKARVLRAQCAWLDEALWCGFQIQWMHCQGMHFFEAGHTFWIGFLQKSRINSKESRSKFRRFETWLKKFRGNFRGNSKKFSWNSNLVDQNSDIIQIKFGPKQIGIQTK